MKIILQGYMASGKSAVAQNLARRLNLKSIDLDHLIESACGKTISEIFAENGEIYFRKAEHTALKNVLRDEDNYVLALGGGTPCYGNNLDLIKNSGAKTIYLKASVGLLAERLASGEGRPLITGPSREDLVEFVAKHLFERNFFYSQSDFTIAVDGKTIDETINEITRLLT